MRAFIAKNIRLYRVSNPTLSGASGYIVAWGAPRIPRWGAEYMGVQVVTELPVGGVLEDDYEQRADFDNTGIPSWAATDITDTQGDIVAWVVYADTDAAPAGTEDLGDPHDRVSLSTTVLAKGKTNRLEDLTGRERGTLEGLTGLAVMRYVARETRWSINFPFEVF